MKKPAKSVFEVKPTGSKPYPVVVGWGIMETLSGEFLSGDPSQVVLLGDERVIGLYGSHVFRLLKGFFTQSSIFQLSFKQGEKNKSRETKRELEDALMERGCGRDALIVGLGGGISTDMAGFLAATYMRGVDYLSFPTSLLAMVDATVGGKTGVNTPFGKNLVGAFHQPRAVVAELAFLETLNESHWKNGFSEMIKHGVVADECFFRFLEERGPHLIQNDKEALEQAVSRSIQIKAEVVERDTFERGMRKILNFGHTIGHALERASGWEVDHGLAVAHGMKAEAKVARDLGLVDGLFVERLEKVLATYGLDQELPPMDPAKALEALRVDKKNRGGEVVMALPTKMGEMFYQDGDPSVCVPEAEFTRCLKQLIGG